MVYKLGRFLQLLGLILVPVALAGNVAREQEVTLGVMLAIAAAGMLLFYIGWLLARPRLRTRDASQE
jgi:hypothetical protein